MQFQEMMETESQSRFNKPYGRLTPEEGEAVADVFFALMPEVLGDPWFMERAKAYVYVSDSRAEGKALDRRPARG